MTDTIHMHYIDHSPVRWADAHTIRGRQMRATAVLRELLRSDLPTATWDVTSIALAEEGDAGELAGQLCSHELDDTGRKAALTAWAAHLGTTPVWKPHGKENSEGSWSVTATIAGVTVKVWVWLDTCPTITAKAGEGR